MSIKSIFEINDNEKIMLDQIIPEELDNLVSVNTLFHTCKVYAPYLPKAGDIFYYASWWISSSQTGNSLTINFNNVKFEVYFKQDNPRIMIQREIINKNDLNKKQKTTGSIYCGDYYFSEAIQLNQNAKYMIYEFEKYKNHFIFAKSFEDLLKNLEIFKDPFCYTIGNSIENMFYKRLEKIKKLTEKYVK